MAPRCRIPSNDAFFILSENLLSLNFRFIGIDSESVGLSMRNQPSSSNSVSLLLEVISRLLAESSDTDSMDPFALTCFLMFRRFSMRLLFSFTKEFGGDEGIDRSRCMDNEPLPEISSRS